MIDKIYLKKIFNLKIIFLFFFISFAIAFLISSYRPFTSYKVSYDFKKIIYLNQLSQIGEDFFIAYNYIFYSNQKNRHDNNVRNLKFNIQEIHDYNQFIPKFHQELNNKNYFFYIRRQGLNKYYLEIITKDKPNLKEIIYFLHNTTDKQIRDFYIKQYLKLIDFINNENKIFHDNTVINSIQLDLIAYENICLKKKLPFKNSFMVNKDLPIKQNFIKIPNLMGLNHFLEELKLFVTLNKKKICINKKFLNDEITNLLKTYEKYNNQTREIIIKQIKGKINQVKAEKKIYNFALEENAKKNLNYIIIDFMKYFFCIFFLLTIFRVIVIKII